MKGLFIAVFLFMSLFSATSAQADKVDMCHATGSDSNPYTFISPAASAAYHAHIEHQDTEDIIPPFEYKGVTYSQNWDAEGQAIFYNGCSPVVPTPTEVVPEPTQVTVTPVPTETTVTPEPTTPVTPEPTEAPVETPVPVTHVPTEPTVPVVTVVPPAVEVTETAIPVEEEPAAGVVNQPVTVEEVVSISSLPAAGSGPAQNEGNMIAVLTGLAVIAFSGAMILRRKGE